MQPVRRRAHVALLILCLVHLGLLAFREIGPTLGIAGFLYPDQSPVGGDFINLWTVGRLVLEGRFDTIYNPDAFMAYQVGFIGKPIGFRLWAYPPHSLLLAVPFGLIGYYPALLLWSVLGLLVLGLGCWRIGLGRWETAIVLLSPASVLCLYYGQTGNLTAGLLLLALSARPGFDATGIAAATLLTIKPQMGFLLPFFWLFERRWVAIAVTGALTLALAALAFVLFGHASWAGYLNDTLPQLSLFERAGTGPFMSMIPSMFMAWRILTGNGDLAIQLHLLLAVPVVGFTLWRLWRLDDPVRRMALVLVATALITPYLHNYDLSILAVAGLLIFRRFPEGSRGAPWTERLLIAMVALPQLVVVLNLFGVPISPLLILPLLFLA